MDKNEKFYEKQWFMWVTLIFLAPVGIFLMWKNNRFAKGPRVAISAVSALIFLVMVVPGQMANSNVATQSRSQTQASNQVTTDKKVATNLNAKIAALGATNSLTLEKADEVKAIRTEFNGLTDAQKNYVTSLAVLTEAENTISNLQIAVDKAASDQATAEIAAAQAAADKATADKEASDKAAAEIAASQSTSSNNGNTSSSSGSSSSVSGGTTTYEPAQGQRTVYWVPNGKSYHYNKNCSTLARSKTILSGPASKCPKTDPCNKCVN